MTRTKIRCGLLMVGFAAIFFLAAGKTSAADFNIVPSSATLAPNQTLTVDIKINAASISVNAAQATLKFSPDVLQVKSISKANSIFNFWLAEPTFSNTDGKLSFLGGTPNGVIGGALQVLRITFAASGAGSSDLTFTDSSITAADGSGKNVVTNANGASFVVAPGAAPSPGASPVPTPRGAIPSPEQITRTPAPAAGLPPTPNVSVTVYSDPTQWFNLEASFTASWTLPSDVSGVSVLLNQSPRTEAPAVSQGLFSSETFPELQDDGIYFLHVRFQNGKGWGPSAHYRIAMDTQPPLPFQINLLTGGLVSTDPAPTLSFRTGDSLSGISKYGIFINSEDVVYSDRGQYQLPPHPPGDYNVLVRAIDQAGNSIESRIKLEIVPIESPAITFITNKIFVGDVLRAKGSINVNYKAVVSVTDKNKFLISQSEIPPDTTGQWSFQLDRPLAPANYTLSVVAKDARGALSLPVTQKIGVKAVPIISLFGLGITLSDLTWFLIIAVAVLVVYFTRRITQHQLRTSMGSVIVSRDIGNAMNEIRKELEKVALRAAKGGDPIVRLSENNTSFNKIKETLDKVEKYIPGEIEKLH